MEKDIKDIESDKDKAIEYLDLEDKLFWLKLL